MWPFHRIPRRHRSTACVLLASAPVVLFSASVVSAATLFGLVDTGELYASLNNGATWAIRATLPTSDGVALAAGSSTTELYIAGRSGTVYRSTTGGSAWIAVGAVTASDVSGLSVNYDGSVLVLSLSGTIYRSTNQGTTFTAVAALTGSNWVSLARGPLGRLYALTRAGEVAESQDGGATWSVVGAVTVSNAVSLRRRGAELYILMETGEVARSLDDGRTWVTVGAMASSDMAALVDLDTSLVGASRTGEIATSANGVAWTWVGAINQLSVKALGTDTPQATGVESGEPSPPRFVLRTPYPNPSVGVEGLRSPSRSHSRISCAWSCTARPGDSPRRERRNGSRVRAPLHYTGSPAS
jgi:Photosynthesis system II assembly factor YCF48